MRDKKYEAGSALILAVVLTSLLAIIGVMFVMMARVDKMATSAISENKELNFAVEAVVAKISQELALDVPGMPKGREYYDYPGDKDKWLASLEPYKEGTVYKWRQISDVTGFLDNESFSTQNIDVKPVGLSTTVYVREYPTIRVGSGGKFLDDKTGNIATDGVSADADGDGIADSKWVEIDDITSDKGKPIYAAIRVIDNGAMLNVNTAYKFDPNAVSPDLIDGSSQTQIDLLVLTKRSSTSNPLVKLDNERFGYEPLPHNLDAYIEDVIWQYNEPNGAYTPFDITNDLELRNRFLLEIENIDTAIETFGWIDVFTEDNYLHTPVDGTSSNLNDWFGKAQYDLSEPNATENYSYRHIGTTYNMDRIIQPDGEKMLNINKAPSAGTIYDTIRKSFTDYDPNFTNVNKIAAQITANLIDYVDGPGYPISDPRYDPNNKVTTVYDDSNKPYYGFERPCVYISEIVHTFKEITPSGGPVGAPPVFYQAYAVELYKPYFQDDDPYKWRLVIGPSSGGPVNAPMGGVPYNINWSGNKQFYVMINDPCLILPAIDPCAVIENSAFIFKRSSIIELQRCIDEANNIWIAVDLAEVPNGLIPEPTDGTLSYRRDINPHKCIRRLWSNIFNNSTLGSDNAFNSGGAKIQAHPSNGTFTNVGEIGMLFHKPAYWEAGQDPSLADVIGYGSGANTEDKVRIDLVKPEFQHLFKYLTVWPPSEYVSDPDETRIKGRININTAPWFVLAQLPWVSHRGGSPDYSLAQAIVTHRDGSSVKGFWNIGELMGVTGMDYYANDGSDLAGFPDLTTKPTGGDDAPDDFEERDVIFARISNLVTVRSDVFTAYILVRIGANGPQKRVMAILDRSNVYSPTDKVKVIALHPVPDPR